MSGKKAIAVLLTALALVLVSPASASLSDLNPTAAQERVEDVLSTTETAPEDLSDGTDGAASAATDIIERNTNDPTAPVEPVAIAEVSLLDDAGEVAHAYLCPNAREGPGDPEAGLCGTEPTTDPAVGTDGFTIQVTLTNPHEPVRPRTVTVVLYENGREVTRTTEQMDVYTSTWTFHKYSSACRCYLPSGAQTQVNQDWTADLPLADGHVGNTYQVVAFSGPDTAEVQDLGAAPSDATGTFTAHKAPSSQAATGPTGSAAGAPAALDIVAAGALGLVGLAGAALWLRRRM